MVEDVLKGMLGDNYVEPTPMDTEEEATAPTDTSPMFEDDGLDEESQISSVEEHLSTLPDDDKEFLAGHLSKEMARIIGLVSGSQVLEQYFNSIANPDIALIPVPRAKAQEMLAQFKSTPTEEQPPVEGPPAQPQVMPGGPMGQPV